MKRSRLTEARGLPGGLVPDGANGHGMELPDSTLSGMPPAAEAARDAHREAGSEQHRGLDAGYDYQPVGVVVAAQGYPAHSRPRGEEVKAKKAGQKARRRVVARTHSGLNRSRHLLIRWAKKPEN